MLDSDWERIAELMEQYIDLPLGMVDASVGALAERRELEIIATLDERPFRVVRPRHTTLRASCGRTRQRLRTTGESGVGNGVQLNLSHGQGFPLP